MIADAEVSVARAQASDGEKYATYETISAELYLQKAKEESGHAHYDAATALARKSIELADLASEKAGPQRNGGAAVPLPRATITHEAAPAPVEAPPLVAPPPPATPPPPPAPDNTPLPPVLIPQGKP